MESLPDLPSGFTLEFLSEILHEHGALPARGHVARIERSLVGAGTGMMAELARLHVEYAGERGAAPATLVAKYASQNPTNREIALAYNLYERESRFMAELGPRTQMRMPRTYYCRCVGDRFLILMEDLGEYRVGSQVEGATLAQSELAMDELAKLHAPFWNRVSDLDWVPGIAHSYHADNMRALAAVGIDAIADRFGPQLAREMRDDKQRFLAAIPAMQAFMHEAPLTLVHGDFRMENLLYGCRPEHDPVAVIDWQGPLRARGMADVALFLAQSTKTEVRRSHERALLARYLGGLRAGGVEGLRADDAFEEYRRSVLYSWVYVVVVAGTLDSSNAAAHAWMSQMVARQTAASRDLEVFPLLPSP